jgi:hypothetical protein
LLGRLLGLLRSLLLHSHVTIARIAHVGLATGGIGHSVMLLRLVMVVTRRSMVVRRR